MLHLNKLDSIFGPEYFEHGRLVLTVARDMQGIMKVAHRLQSKVHEHFGAVVEVFMEHVKQELWVKLHEATQTMGLHKGPEVSDVQVTDIPEGIRVHPYKREHLPTLEVLLLWDDVSGVTRGHVLYSISHPSVPQLDQVDHVFDELAPYFAKRWIVVELRLAPPLRGEFEEDDAEGADRPPHDSHVGRAVAVTLLACHASGFARGEGRAAHVSMCPPMVFKGITDDAGGCKICFLPAETNKVQVAETELFYGSEVILTKDQLVSRDQGPTVLRVELTPKGLAAMTIHLFVRPPTLPLADEYDGIIDWAAEERTPLPEASVKVTPMKDGAPSMNMVHAGGGVFRHNTLPEGCIDIVCICPGYGREEKTMMLLVGQNEFYIPMTKAGS